MSVWTEEKVASLKRLRADNLDSVEIAEKLGGTITARQVTQKLNSLGLRKKERPKPSCVKEAQGTVSKRLALRRFSWEE